MKWNDLTETYANPEDFIKDFLDENCCKDCINNYKNKPIFCGCGKQLGTEQEQQDKICSECI